MAENRGEFNEINITPLTDIFLVLLIIMMVIAPMLDQQGLNLTVPENVAEQVHNKDVKILTVRISPEDRFFIDEQEVSAEQLQGVIGAKSKEYPDGVLIVENVDQQFVFDGAPMYYSSSREVDYNGDELDIIIYFSGETEYRKGVYTVEVYTDESLLGTADMLLK